MSRVFSKILVQLSNCAKNGDQKRLTSLDDVIASSVRVRIGYGTWKYPDNSPRADSSPIGTRALKVPSLVCKRVSARLSQWPAGIADPG